MRVFVTGASGWIGSAVVPELLDAGHQVVGLARSDASAAKLEAAGADVLRGDLDDLDTLGAGAASSDGVIHLAFIHDFTRFEDSVSADARAIATLGAALDGSGKPLVIASGTPAVPGRVATERDEPGAVGPAAARGANAQAARVMAARGVRSSVVRLPRTVHGEGDLHGFIPQLITIARQKGVSGFVGDGSSRWPAVHVLDAAHLFRLAVEEAPAGSVLHGIDDEGVPTREIAAVIGRHLNLPTSSIRAEDFGFLGMVLAGDQPASSALTRKLLGWRPVQPGLIEDLDKGHYFRSGRTVLSTP
jgi:nucleoside-diphosphate-sugar epimerase